MRLKINKKQLLLLSLVLYFVATALTYAGIKAFGGKAGGTTNTVATPTAGQTSSKFKVDPSLPKDQECPLNGEKFTKPEKEIWVGRRPLMVMIENHQDSRPQSGLSASDVVYEAVAEGGITRFMAVFFCNASAEDVQIGPVRSARTYYLDFASEYGDKPLYVHVGGANSPGPANALGQIEDYDWAGVNDMNQFSIGFPTFWRDYDRLGHEVATEHTMYSTTAKLWAYAASKRKLSATDAKGVSWDSEFIPYKFKEDEVLAKRPGSASLSFVFWNKYNDYAVKWDYDKKTNSYLRINAELPHTDRNNNQQLSAKNVVTLFMNESNANDGYENNAHLLYKTKGTGTAKVYSDGIATDAKWQKKDRTSRLKLTDANSGEEIKFNRGRIWFEVLATGTKVTETNL